MIFVYKSFADHHEAVFLLGEHAADVFEILIHREGDFRQIDQVWRAGRIIAEFGEGCPCRDPSGVAAHDFENVDQVVLAHSFVVLGYFTHQRRNVFDHAAVSRAVVRSHQVIVDGLWDTNHTERIVALLCEF
ncbi:MAG: hypothetical protein BWY82_02830 [Verrucomicrobia bacterium ADurb.Bin474]|nr:MAG: hypothetical protein BWY82_02830 [Verrucomicrobia bacterium ADurb.Bin474]